jgi:hypothetical protein
MKIAVPPLFPPVTTIALCGIAVDAEPELVAQPPANIVTRRPRVTVQSMRGRDMNFSPVKKLADEKVKPMLFL